MKNFFNIFKKQVFDYWSNLTKPQKIKLSIIAGVSFISVILLVIITTRPNYVTLYSNLSEADAGAITTKLKGDMKVPYKLANGGSTILVPEQYRDEARMQLATQGLPQNGFTIDDAFKNSSLGTTDLERQKRYYYFLQSEIASAIKTLNGVQDAQVLIVVPDDNSFVLSNTSSEATAAVKVVLNPGVKLNKNQIDGIIQFVSKSVQGLKPENVTLIDSNGAILNDAGSADNISSVSDQYDLKSEIESHIKDNVQSLLEQIYGPGNVVVRVNANLNFDTQKENSVQYTPVVDTNGIVRSIQNIKETQKNSTTTGQTPGISNNGGGNTNSTVVQGNQTTSPSDYTKTQETVNYEINEIQKEIEKAKGSIDNLSIAVVINNNNLSASTKQQVAKLVSSATGTNTTNVTVDSMKFNKSLLNSLNNMNKNNLPLNMIFYGIGLTILLAGGVSTVLVLRNKNREKNITETEILKQMEEEDSNKLLDRLDEKTKNRIELENLIKEKPDVVAQLIKTLMQQD